MASFPPYLPQVPIVVPEGFASPGGILPLPIGSTVSAIGVTLGALHLLSAAAEASADERPRQGPQSPADRTRLVKTLVRITLARLVWAHLDPIAAAPFFEHDSDCVRGQSADGTPTTYLYRGRFLFTVEVSDGVIFLDAPADSLAS